MQIVGNWNYAGTNKFVSHALTEDGNSTLCGMDVHKLMARRSQQWEYEDSDVCGCVKCNRHLTQRAADEWQTARFMDE